MSAGDTPDILDACPTDTGFKAVSFSFASLVSFKPFCISLTSLLCSAYSVCDCAIFALYISVLPLRVASISGFVFAALGMLLGVYFVVRKLMHPEIVMGYSSIVSLLMFTGGILMLLLGMIGEYIGRIYICMNGAPQYVVRDRVNF